MYTVLIDTCLTSCPTSRLYKKMQCNPVSSWPSVWHMAPGGSWLWHPPDGLTLATWHPLFIHVPLTDYFFQDVAQEMAVGQTSQKARKHWENKQEIVQIRVKSKHLCTICCVAAIFSLFYTSSQKLHMIVKSCSLLTQIYTISLFFPQWINGRWFTSTLLEDLCFGLFSIYIYLVK